MSKLLGKIKNMVSELDEEEKKEWMKEKNYNLYQPTKEELETYKIGREEAFLIASRNENLKTDYVKNTKDNITYLRFLTYQSGIVKKKNHAYWYIIITEADISYSAYEYGSLTLIDGTLKEEELKKLRCYVDTQTGKYYYSL